MLAKVHNEDFKQSFTVCEIQKRSRDGSDDQEAYIGARSSFTISIQGVPRIIEIR